MHRPKSEGNLVSPTPSREGQSTIPIRIILRALAAAAAALSTGGLITTTASADALATLGSTTLGTLGGATKGSAPRDAVLLNGSRYYVADDGDHGAELWRSIGDGAGTMVADLASTGIASNITNLTSDGSALWFTARDDRGTELWTSDGTAAGTHALTDPVGDPSKVTLLGVLDGQALFGNDDGTGHGDELWTSDGTTAGTHELKNINSGGGSSFPGQGATATDRVFFTADDGTDDGTQLWVTDGTASGTRKVKDLGSGVEYSDLTASGDDLFFNTSSDGDPTVPYASDGTSAGTVALIGLRNAVGFVPFDGATYFVADDGSTDGLYASDGTAAGTDEVKTINPVAGDAGTEGLTVAGSTLYFNADDGDAGNELWASDGTGSGTHEVENINLPGSSFPKDITAAAGDSVYFSADDGAGDGRELWTSDGTAGGTQRVADINPTGDSNPTNMLWDGTLLWFRARSADHGDEAWTTDGTAAGTTSHPVSTTGGYTVIGSARAGSRIVTAVTSPTGSEQLLVSDGTSGGTHGPSTQFDVVGPLASLGGKAYFFGVDRTSHRYKLWITDGTDGGTGPIADVVPSTGGAPIVSGGKLYFTSQSGGVTSSQLWVSDGTASGTSQVTDDEYTIWVSDVTPYAGGVAFSAVDLDSNRQAWVSDGTTAGTRALSIAGVSDPEPNTFGALGGTLFFAGQGTGSDTELYASDGTSAGTHPVGSGLGSNGAFGWTDAGGKLFYISDQGAHARQLWVTDGTAGGTHEVTALGGGSWNDGPQNLTVLDGKLVFTVGDVPGVWTTDGTTTTQLATTIGENPTLRRVGDRVYFAGFDDTHGSELWATDGTAAGTGLVSDLVGGAGSSHPQVLGDLDGKAVVLGDAPGSGSVLYGVDAPAAPPAGGDDGGDGGTTTTTTTTQTTPAVTTTTTTTPTTPAPAPAPVPVKTPVASRAAATVTLSAAKPATAAKPPFRWVVSGRVSVPKGVAKAKACAGTVTVTARRGDVVVARATAELTKACTYSVTISKATYKRLAARGGKLVLVARFAGNAALLPARSQEASVRYGGR